jgi:predicted amidophosphoribosyltransferase
MIESKYCSNCGTNFKTNEEHCLVCAQPLDGIDYNARYCLDSRNQHFHICSRECLTRFNLNIHKLLLKTINKCKAITFEELQKNNEIKSEVKRCWGESMIESKYCSNCGTNFKTNEEHCLVCAQPLDGIDYNARYCLDSRNQHFHICSRECLTRFNLNIHKLLLKTINKCKAITFEELQKNNEIKSEVKRC